MPDEKIDKAKGITDTFTKDLRALQSADSHRVFVLRYFCTEQERETMLNIIGLAELSGKELQEWDAFQKLFKLKSYREFSKKIGSFQDEGIRLGFLQ